MWSGVLFLAGELDQLYGWQWIAATLFAQVVCFAEAVLVLARYERSDREAGALTCFCLLIGACGVALAAVGNPEGYGHWSLTLYLVRTGIHVFITMTLGAMLMYQFAIAQTMPTAGKHVLILWAWFTGSLVAHAIKDQNRWATSNITVLAVHLGCVVAWTLLYRKPVVISLQPLKRSLHPRGEV
jgi:hypothetical protein